MVELRLRVLIRRDARLLDRDLAWRREWLEPSDSVSVDLGEADDTSSSTSSTGSFSSSEECCLTTRDSGLGVTRCFPGFGDGDTSARGRSSSVSGGPCTSSLPSEELESSRAPSPTCLEIDGVRSLGLALFECWKGASEGRLKADACRYAELESTDCRRLNIFVRFGVIGKGTGMCIGELDLDEEGVRRRAVDGERLRTAS